MRYDNERHRTGILLCTAFVLSIAAEAVEAVLVDRKSGVSRDGQGLP